LQVLKKSFKNLFNIFFWNGNKLYSIQRQSIQTITLSPENKIIRTRYTIFNESYLVDYNELYASFYYLLIELFDSFFISEQDQKHLDSAKNIDEKYDIQTQQIQCSVGLYFINRKIQISSFLEIIKKHNLILAKKIKMNNFCEQIDDILDYLDSKEILFICHAQAELKFPEYSEIREILCDADLNVRCSYCDKEIVHWKNNFIKNNGENILMTSQFEGASGLTHYCSFDCKYFHKFEHNEMFKDKEQEFFNDALFKILKVSTHPQNEFSHITNTISEYFSLQSSPSSEAPNLTSISSKSPPETLTTDPEDIKSRLHKRIQSEKQILMKLGYQNIGNTCYMNSVLQLFLSTCEEIYITYFCDSHKLLACLESHREMPISISYILVMFETIFGSSDFQKSLVLEKYLSYYITDKVKCSLQSQTNKQVKGSSIEEEANDDDRGNVEAVAANQTSSKFERYINEDKNDSKFQNKVNPVMLKYFIGCQREEFASFGQADGHELFITLLDLLDNEKSEISKLVHSNFNTKLINQFTCVKCGHVKNKEEYSNIISVSFENAVKSVNMNNYDVLIADTSSIEMLSLAKTSQNFSSLSLPTFNEHIDSMYKDQEKDQMNNETNPVTYEQCDYMRLSEVHNISEMNPQKEDKKIQHYISLFASLSDLSIPHFDIIESSFNPNTHQNFKQFMNKYFSFNYIQKHLKSNQIMFIYPFNPETEYMFTLNINQKKVYGYSGMLSTCSILSPRLLRVQREKLYVHELAVCLYNYFEPLLLKYFFDDQNIAEDYQISSMWDIFKGWNEYQFAQIIFLQEVNLKEIFEENLKNGVNLEIDEKCIPEYFEKLLGFLKKIFSLNNLKIYIPRMNNQIKQMKIFSSIIKKLKQNLIAEENESIEEEENEDEPTQVISPSSTSETILNNYIFNKEYHIDFLNNYNNIHIEFKGSNTLTGIIERLRKLEKKTFNDMNLKMDNSHISVHDCLRGFFQSSILELNCSKCKEGKEFATQYLFDRGSKYLAVHIKRFMPRIIKGEYKFVKNSSKIKVDKEIELEGHVYQLEGIVNHFGKINAGHYTFERVIELEEPQKKTKVVEYDDNTLKIYTYKNFEIQSIDPYIVLYKRVISD
jgi:ubiquitin C-terminal hydrolase